MVGCAAPTGCPGKAPVDVLPRLVLVCDLDDVVPFAVAHVGWYHRQCPAVDGRDLVHAVDLLGLGSAPVNEIADLEVVERCRDRVVVGNRRARVDAEISRRDADRRFSRGGSNQAGRHTKRDRTGHRTLEEGAALHASSSPAGGGSVVCFRPKIVKWPHIESGFWQT